MQRRPRTRPAAAPASAHAGSRPARPSTRLPLRAPSPRPRLPQLRSSGHSPHCPNTGTRLPPQSGPRGLLTPTSDRRCAGRKARRQLLQSAYDRARDRTTAGNCPRPRCKRLGFWSPAGRPSSCLPSALGLRPSEAARRRLGAAAARRGGPSPAPPGRHHPGVHRGGGRVGGHVAVVCCFLSAEEQGRSGPDPLPRSPPPQSWPDAPRRPAPAARPPAPAGPAAPHLARWGEAEAGPTEHHGGRPGSGRRSRRRRYVKPPAGGRGWAAGAPARSGGTGPHGPPRPFCRCALVAPPPCTDRGCP